MTEYLEKAALVRILRAKAEMGRLSEYSVCFDNVAKMIELLPTANVEEVKHGKWVKSSVIKCSVCGSCTDIQSDEAYEKFIESYCYCPVCGSKLDLED